MLMSSDCHTGCVACFSRCSTGCLGCLLAHPCTTRTPQVNILCAMIGAGSQLFVMCLALLSMALLGVFQPSKRGSIVTACIVLYTLSAGVGGYGKAAATATGGCQTVARELTTIVSLSVRSYTSFVSARLYRQLKGTNWVWNIMMCAGAFPRTCVVRHSRSLVTHRSL